MIFTNEYDVLDWLVNNPEICYELKNILRLNSCINAKTLYAYVFQSTLAGNIFSADVYKILNFYTDDIIRLYELGKLSPDLLSEIIIKTQDAYAVTISPPDVNMLVLSKFLNTHGEYSETFLDSLLSFCKEAHCQSEIVYRSAAKILNKQITGENTYIHTLVEEFEKFVYGAGAGYWEKNIIPKLLYQQGYYRLYLHYRFLI